MPPGCEGPRLTLSPQFQPSILSQGFDQDVMNSYLIRTQTNLFTMDPPVLFISWCHARSPSDLVKHSISKPVSKAAKVRKTVPKAFKNTTHLPSNHQKTLFAKTPFLQYLAYDNLVLRAPTVNNSTQKTMQKTT